jgi:hypothetical protein
MIGGKVQMAELLIALVRTVYRDFQAMDMMPLFREVSVGHDSRCNTRKHNSRRHTPRANSEGDEPSAWRCRTRIRREEIIIHRFGGRNLALGI